MSKITEQELSSGLNTKLTGYDSTKTEVENARGGQANLDARLDGFDTQLAQKANTADPTFTGLITSAGQIKFPATQAASSDPNTLDDYEEGTFTPTLLGSLSNPTVNYASGTSGGRYIKIGKMVFVSLEVRWNSLSGGSGDVYIGNLPFMRVSTLQPDGDRVVVQSYNNSYLGNTLTGNIVLGSNYTYIESSLSGSTTQSMNISGLTTGFGFIRFSGTYEATA